jgi:transposase
VHTCQQVVKRQQALWTCLETPRIKPAKDVVFYAGVRALRPSVMHRKISNGLQSCRGAICLSRLLTITLRQQCRDVWDFLEQAWIAPSWRGGDAITVAQSLSAANQSTAS